MLHSSVSCCICLMLFGGSGGGRSDGGMTRRQRMWCGELGASGQGGRCAGVLRTRCCRGMAAAGCACGARRMASNRGRQKSVVCARRVIRTCGRCDGTACAYRTKKKINGRRQAARVGLDRG
jgi:hypothetical protein